MSLVGISTLFNVGLVRNKDAQAIFKIDLSNKFQAPQELVKGIHDTEIHSDRTNNLLHDTGDLVLGSGGS